MTEDRASPQEQRINQDTFFKVFDAYQSGELGSSGFDEVLCAARQIGDGNHQEHGSALVHVILKSKNKSSALPIVQALVEGGCDPSDALTPQRHERAINQALSVKAYEITTWLIEHGGDANNLVPEWFWRPKTAKHAKQVVKLYESAWPKWNITMQSRYLSAAVVDLIAAEMIGKCDTSDKLRLELTDMLVKSQEFNTWDRGLAAMDDGLRGAKTTRDATALLDRCLERWFVALDGDGTSKDPEGLRRSGAFKENIPKDWINRLADEITSIRHRDTLEQSTPTNNIRPGARRI